MKFVSIVVPTYNRKEKLNLTLDSLIHQKYPKKNYEIIIIDDGSIDGTYQFLQEKVEEISNLRIFKQSNKGPASARNFGIKKANGEILYFTDDDCIVPENWLTSFLEVFESHPEVVGVGGFLEAPENILKSNVFAKYESYISTKLYNVYKEGPVQIGGFEVPTVVTNNCAYRRDVLIELKGFDESFPFAAGEDADLKFRVTLQGNKIAYIPIKVTHMQDYSFNRFIKQKKTLVLGDIRFKEKWDNYLKEEKANKSKNLFFSMLTDRKIDLVFIYLILSTIGILFKMNLKILTENFNKRSEKQ